MIARVLLAASVAIPLCAVARAGVIVVQAGGPFTTIQQAVDAAQSGDVVLVKGTWNGSGEVVAITGKGISILRDFSVQGLEVHLGRIAVRQVPPGETVVLRGLDLVGVPFVPAIATLLLEDNGGAVRVGGCRIRGLEGFKNATLVSGQAGGPGVRIDRCADVDLWACTLWGGDGATADGDDPLGTTDGGPAVVVAASAVSLHQCTAQGGHGGVALTGAVSGSSGCEGVRNEGATLQVQGGILLGGAAGHGHCDASGCGTNGSAAHAFASVSAAATTTIRDPVLVNGITAEPPHDPLPGPATLVTAGTLLLDPTDSNTLSLDPTVRELKQAIVAVTGPPGDKVFVQVSVLPGWKPVTAQHGVLLLGGALSSTHVSVGTVGTSFVVASFPVPALPPGLDELTAWLQVVIKRGSDVLLGPAASVTVLAAAL